MTIDEAIWIVTFVAVGLAIAIVWTGMKKNHISRDDFVRSLSEEDRNRLDVHELLGGDWKTFERTQSDLLEGNADTIQPATNMKPIPNRASDASSNEGDNVVHHS